MICQVFKPFIYLHNLFKFRSNLLRRVNQVMNLIYRETSFYTDLDTYFSKFKFNGINISIDDLNEMLGSRLRRQQLANYYYIKKEIIRGNIFELDLKSLNTLFYNDYFNLKVDLLLNSRSLNIITNKIGENMKICFMVYTINKFSNNIYYYNTESFKIRYDEIYRYNIDNYLYFKFFVVNKYDQIEYAVKNDIDDVDIKKFYIGDLNYDKA